MCCNKFFYECNNEVSKVVSPSIVKWYFCLLVVSCVSKSSLYASTYDKRYWYSLSRFFDEKHTDSPIPNRSVN